jgi:hypothetical protein
LVVNYKDGTIVKWNINQSLESKSSLTSKYKYVHIPILLNKEIPFPHGSKVAAELLPKQPALADTNNTHILREFYYEHKYFFNISLDQKLFY